MAVARKSDISATGSWFRTAIQNRRNRRSTNLQKQSTHQKIPTKSVPVRSKGNVISSPVSVTDTLQKRKVSIQHHQVPLPLEKPRWERLVSSRVEVTSPRAEATTELSSQDSLPSIPVMPNSRKFPSWLLRLYAIHRHSSVAAFLFVTVTLVVYGWTVYSQQLWSQAYRKLQDLQHHERQLTTINGELKEKMAQDAQRPAAGLVSPTPSGTIFLPRSPVGLNPVSPNTTPNSEIQQQTVNPVGY